MVCGMTDPNRSDRDTDPTRGHVDVPPARQGPPPTPFDHPLFLPALLFAGMLWFGYDGWINQDPDMQEHLSFNRYGFGVLTLLTAWFGYKGYREWQEEKAERDAKTSAEPAGPSH